MAAPLTALAACPFLTQAAPAVGAYCLATLLAGWVYDRNAQAHGAGDVCVGQDCFRATFATVSVLGSCAALGSLVLLRVSRPTYQAGHIARSS